MIAKHVSTTNVVQCRNKKTTQICKELLLVSLVRCQIIRKFDKYTKDNIHVWYI